MIGHRIELKGEEMELHPLKAIYWKKEKALLIADFHIGKSAHFQRNGILVHSGIDQVNIKNLNQLIKTYPTEKVIFLGDLFHSKFNDAWKAFKTFINRFKDISFQLVLGNHDILPEETYHQSNIKIFRNELAIGPFLITHHPLENWKGESYNLSGHIHPGVMLKGDGKQYMRMPCFYFGIHQGIMPAFGGFTGLSIIKPDKKDQIYVPAGNEVICL